MMKYENKIDIKSAYTSRNRRLMYIILAMSITVLILAILTLIYGNTVYPIGTIFKVLMGENISGATFTIMTLRLPRMLAAILCGLAFGMAGYIFQSLLSNPLASPDIIGITSGSSVAAVFAILFLGLEGAVVSMIAVVAGILVSGMIYGISSLGGFSNSKMVLTGIGFQYFFLALMSWLLLLSSEYDVPKALHWISGSINDVKIEEIPVLFLVVIVCGSMLVYFEKYLGIIELGDEYATALGLDLKKSRLILVFLSLLLLAFATSVSGPLSSISFLSSPIATRMMKGNRKNALIPSALIGAILVLASDLVGQNLFAVRYPVGVITGILGAPYLLLVLLRVNKRSD